jgi:hypothetical protein
MMHSETIGNISAALAAAQAFMPAVPKDSTNPHFKSKFASLDGIVERTKPVLAKHDLAIVQGTSESAPGTVCVTTMLVHKSGEYLLTSVTVPLVKNDPQGVGSAITYGRRYGFAAILSLAADEDDDGNSSSHKPEAVKAATKAAPLKSLDDTNVMPTGPYAGKELIEVPTAELQALAKYLREHKNATKYSARLIALETEINRRGDSARENGGLHPALAGVGAEKDDLPFK